MVNVREGLCTRKELGAKLMEGGDDLIQTKKAPSMTRLFLLYIECFILLLLLLQLLPSSLSSR